MDDSFSSYCCVNRQVLGSKIKRLRFLMNMSQKAFANFVGISPANLSRIEHGSKNYNVDTLLLICFKLNVYLDFTL